MSVSVGTAPANTTIGVGSISSNNTSLPAGAKSLGELFNEWSAATGENKPATFPAFLGDHLANPQNTGGAYFTVSPPSGNPVTVHLTLEGGQFVAKSPDGQTTYDADVQFDGRLTVEGFIEVRGLPNSEGNALYIGIDPDSKDPTSLTATWATYDIDRWGGKYETAAAQVTELTTSGTPATVSTESTESTESTDSAAAATTGVFEGATGPYKVEIWNGTVQDTAGDGAPASILNTSAPAGLEDGEYYVDQDGSVYKRNDDTGDWNPINSDNYSPKTGVSPLTTKQVNDEVFVAPALFEGATGPYYVEIVEGSSGTNQVFDAKGAGAPKEGAVAPEGLPEGEYYVDAEGLTYQRSGDTDQWVQIDPTTYQNLDPENTITLSSQGLLALDEPVIDSVAGAEVTRVNPAITAFNDTYSPAVATETQVIREPNLVPVVLIQVESTGVYFTPTEFDNFTTFLTTNTDYDITTADGLETAFDAYHTQKALDLSNLDLSNDAVTVTYESTKNTFTYDYSDPTRTSDTITTLDQAIFDESIGVDIADHPATLPPSDSTLPPSDSTAGKFNTNYSESTGFTAKYKENGDVTLSDNEFVYTFTAEEFDSFTTYLDDLTLPASNLLIDNAYANWKSSNAEIPEPVAAFNADYSSTGFTATSKNGEVTLTDKVYTHTFTSNEDFKDFLGYLNNLNSTFSVDSPDELDIAYNGWVNTNSTAA